MFFIYFFSESGLSLFWITYGFNDFYWAVLVGLFSFLIISCFGEFGDFKIG
jgi:hypothetical protein